jgi:hypothetical protein
MGIPTISNSKVSRDTLLDKEGSDIDHISATEDLDQSRGNGYGKS